MYIIDKTSSRDRISNNRSDDLRRLENHISHNPDPAARAAAEQAIYAIKHEDKHIRAMREDLVKAHRDNDTHKIKEINHIVMEDKKYQNE